jgi:hypothetical protein
LLEKFLNYYCIREDYSLSIWTIIATFLDVQCSFGKVQCFLPKKCNFSELDKKLNYEHSLQ